MTVSLTDVRCRLAEFIENNVHGVSVYPHVPSMITPPAVIVRPAMQERLTSQRGFVATRFGLVCAVGMGDTIDAQDVLDEMLSFDGDRSIVAAFDRATEPLGSALDVDLEGWDSYDTRTIGDTDYLTATINVRVIGEGN